ncbi:MAG TPA: hypothetical protein ENH82_00365 [bacterium]|nr:hypothetical protein [bacterium]
MNLFEHEHVNDILLRNRQISRTIDSAMKDLARRFTTVKGRRFARVMNKRLALLHDHLLKIDETGIRNQWILSNRMTNKSIDGYLAGVTVSDALIKSFRNPNLSALNAFITRSQNGFNLSQRVWNITDEIKSEMTDLISTGVLEGKSAIVLSKELTKYVKGRPIRYKGTLIPGKNLTFQSIRLAANEMNMAFRTSDFLQNSQLPFTTGVTVHLSAAHPRPDICDEMQGEYPKGFEFVGWHILCICFATYDTLPKEDFAKYIEGGKINQKFYMKGIPKRAQSYINKNGQRLLGYKNVPFWMETNFTQDLKLRQSVKIGGRAK